MYLGIKLETDILLHSCTVGHLNILCVQVHLIISALPGCKAPIRLGKESDLTNRVDKFKLDRLLCFERIARLQRENLRLQQNHGWRITVNHTATSFIRFIVQVQLYQNKSHLCWMYLVDYQFELFHLDEWVPEPG